MNSENQLADWTAFTPSPASAGVSVRLANNDQQQVFGGNASLELQAGCAWKCFTNAVDFDGQPATTNFYPSILPLVDISATLHVFYTQGATEIKHRSRSGSNPWSAPITVTAEGGNLPVLTFATGDASGNLHLIYHTLPDVRYMRRDATNTWSAPITIGHYLYPDMVSFAHLPMAHWSSPAVETAPFPMLGRLRPAYGHRK